MAHRVNLGDYFEIPLGDHRFAYCQYIRRHKEVGDLVRVVDLISDRRIRSIQILNELGNMFPPVFVDLRPAVNKGIWRKLGNGSIAPFEFPRFRSTPAYEPGVYDTWSIWDGRESRFIGKLPTELRSLERKGVWGHEILEERIRKGETPFDGVN